MIGDLAMKQLLYFLLFAVCAGVGALPAVMASPSEAGVVQGAEKDAGADLTSPEATKADSNSDLAKVAMYTSTALTALVIIAFVAGLCFAWYHDPARTSDTIKTIFGDGTALRIVTVFVVLGAAALLAIADKLDKGILALLSGIVGYVLGGLGKPERERPLKDGAAPGSQDQSQKQLHSPPHDVP